MAYTLYGSYPSPFVRRIRMLLEGIPFEFKDMNIYETADAVELNKINPVNQIPVFQDGERTIWDSRQIFYYLNQQHKLQNMDWADENLLTVMEGAINAGVALLLMKRSGIDVKEPYMYVQRQKDRIDSVLDYLKDYLNSERSKVWDFHAMTLYSFIDWAKFRQVTSFESRPECEDFLATHSNRIIVKQTAIPGN